MIFLIFFISNGIFAEKKRYGTINDQINCLLEIHQKSLNSIFREANNSLDSFDKLFFTDFSFMNHNTARQFFDNIQVNLQNGSLPVHKGMTMVSFSEYSNINGKVTGVNYRFTSNGQNIQLLKGTYKDGKLIKAVYNYDLQGKLLKTKEIKGDKIINESTELLNI